MERAELVYEEGATYRVKEAIKCGGAAFLLPDSDEIIPQTGDHNPTPICVGHTVEEVDAGDLVTATRREFDNGIKLTTLHRSVRVIAKETNTCHSWFNTHIGETFRVVKFHGDGIPKKYEVDISDLMKRGEITVDRGYINVACAEVVR